MSLRCHVLIALAVLLAAGLPASADITFTGSSGSLAASALFSLTGSTLTVTLTNTSLADVLVPTDVLMGLLFNTAHTLTPVSASLNGSSVFYGSLANNVGEGWVYGHPISAQGENSGISATGLGGIFGNTNFFYTPPHTPLDGTNYGILSHGDNTATGNNGVKGHGPLIKDSIQFTLAAGLGFSLSDIGDQVVFQYGTATDEPHFDGDCQDCVTQQSSVPEPVSLLLFGTVLVLSGRQLQRRLRPRS